MRLVVIIATVDRKTQLTQLLTQLERQRRLPDEIIVSAPDESHVDAYEGRCLPVSYVFGQRGSSAQRNSALERALRQSDIITFFDDDFIPADNYLGLVASYFENNPNWAVIRGYAVQDGATSAGLTFKQGLAALHAAEANASVKVQVRNHVGGYGCNMSIRSRLIGDLRFDERLVLYGWQEDIDFTSQLRQRGRVVGVNTLIGVHLGLKAGRVSGVRFGYSQIINPVYLIKKGTIPMGFAVRLMTRNLIANAIKSLWPEPYVDRRGRLRGNLIAACHLMLGRIEPEYILRI
jgi:GT2 family glycosyltransferase